MSGTFEFPKVFEKRIGELNLPDFEREQLLLSHEIADQLFRIEDILCKINNRLGKIEEK